MIDAITVDNLVVAYPRPGKPPLRAVDGLSFRVAPGEIVGFLGINGAGKTSTIKSLMGFQPATSGTAILFNKPVQEATSRGNVGFLPETALYSPFLTPHETLWLHGELHGMERSAIRERIQDLLRLVGLSEKAHVQNRTLSKGMLQRVGIAQALLARPRLLVMDEVSSGLDPLGRRDLRNLLKEQRDDGVTIFFSSHQLGEAELICDRILVIHQGRLIAERTIEELRRRVTSLEDFFVTLVESGRDPLLDTREALEALR
ncbi:MAG: ABC transporter ATP-binding protein [Acidobacteria bacterium]|nr:ABC transporter ATP-binding protein [Acidobacteriota bacterium]